MPMGNGKRLSDTLADAYFSQAIGKDIFYETTGSRIPVCRSTLVGADNQGLIIKYQGDVMTLPYWRIKDQKISVILKNKVVDVPIPESFL